MGLYSVQILIWFILSLHQPAFTLQCADLFELPYFTEHRFMTIKAAKVYQNHSYGFDGLFQVDIRGFNTGFLKQIPVVFGGHNGHQLEKLFLSLRQPDTENILLSGRLEYVDDSLYLVISKIWNKLNREDLLTP